MPELPEVETIRRGLEPLVTGRTIGKVIPGDPLVLRVAPASLKRRLRGRIIRRLWRRGKFLIFDLDRNHLVIHLGMTGQLTFRDRNRPDSRRFHRHPVTGLQRARQHPPDRHTHLQIGLEGGGRILYRDIRKFGRIDLLSSRGRVLEDFLSRLGLEPFGEDYRLEGFLDRFARRKLRIKSLLLDQSFVAGIGNIYADEALFESGIHPGRRIPSVRGWEREELFSAIPRVLERGIVHGGTSLRDYVNSDGEQGSNQERLRVYGRESEPCTRCGTPIRRTVMSQRSTHYCPRCQPRRGRRRV